MPTVTGGDIPTGDEITWYIGDAATGLEFAASSEVSIEFSHDVLERSVHGSTTKLTKTGAGTATATLTDVLVNGNIIRNFVGTVTNASPTASKTTFSWSAAAPVTVALITGVTTRAGSPVLTTKLINAKITDGSLDYPEDDFSTTSLEFTIDNFQLVYTTPA